METFLKILGAGILILLLVFGLATLSAWFVMILVNYLFTPAMLMAIFGVAKLGLFKSWCLTLLLSILFKSTSYSSNSSK